MLELAVHSPMNAGNQFFKTSWRNTPSWYGGFFQDGAVHFVAAMRKVAGSEPATVSATVSHRAAHLPGPDTIAAIVRFESGLQGVVNMGFATVNRKFDLSVTGSSGKVSIERGVDENGKHGYAVTRTLFQPDADNKLVDTQTTGYPFCGVPDEFVAFAAAVGAPSGPEMEALDCNTPEEAMADLAFIEACLESGKNGGQPVGVANFLRESQPGN